MNNTANSTVASFSAAHSTVPSASKKVYNRGRAIKDITFKPNPPVYKGDNMDAEKVYELLRKDREESDRRAEIADAKFRELLKSSEERTAASISRIEAHMGNIENKVDGISSEICALKTGMYESELRLRDRIDKNQDISRTNRNWLIGTIIAAAGLIVTILKLVL